MTPTPYYRGAKKDVKPYTVRHERMHREHAVTSLGAALGLALDWASRSDVEGDVVEVLFGGYVGEREVEAVAKADGRGGAHLLA